MAFIIIFVLISLAMMLSGEIYKNGKNNAVVHSLEDVKLLMSSFRLSKSTLRLNKSVIGTAQAILAIVLSVVAIFLVLKLTLFMLVILLGWIIS